MEKLIDILSKILASIQVVFNAVLSLIFQPLFYLISIIQGIIEVWQEECIEPPVEGQQVTQYPSANEGKFAEECELPIGRQRIGFKNQHELEELEKIKRQLKGEN